MKIMIVGEWRYPIYEEAFAGGIEENGVKVMKVEIGSYFDSGLGRIQQVLPIISYSLKSINQTILKKVSVQKPDFVLFWRPTHILPGTVKMINQLGIPTISYNNDDPFGYKPGRKPWHHFFLWYWYLKTLPFYQVNFFYRKKNVQEAMELGASNNSLLMPYFRPGQDRPMELSTSEKEKFDADFVFVGHYEEDGRLNYLKILEQTGYRVKIWGDNSWKSADLSSFKSIHDPVEPVYGDDYTKALCGSKICLVFLSKMNRDVYTRRCFEIPATGRVMLAERTDELKEMFVEDKEACYFSGEGELLEKANWLMNHPERADEIAEAGLKKVWQGGHDVTSRAEEFLKQIEEFTR